MEKMRRIAALLMAVMMSAAVFTGCGDSDDDDDTAKGSKKKSAAVDDNDDDEDDDEEEETTKRVRKRQPKDEEEDTTEPETEEETEPETEEETEEETTQAPTKAASKDNTLEIVPGVELRMTLDEVKTAIGDKAGALEELYDGYDCTTYAFPVDGAFGVDMEGYCFFDINRDSGKLQTYGYHLGDSGDMADPDYPYSEAELKSAYNEIISQFEDVYGDSTGTNDMEDMGVRSMYTYEFEDGSSIWAIYGIDLWSWDDYHSGINDIIISLSIPDDERFD